LDGENIKGVYPSMQLLKAFNLRGKELAKGHVGIIGGGNSAVDAARVAIRQKKVKSVTLLYRRTTHEMPAYAEEVDAAIEEGIKLETLVSPVKIRYIGEAQAEGVRVETFVSPIRIDSEHGHLADIRCIRNKLGEMDSSGRRKPIPIQGSEFTIPLDTLIVAIGERPDSDCLTYLRGEELREPPEIKLPKFFIEPAAIREDELEEVARAEPATISVKSRRNSFAEVEMVLSEEQARREARRCLRCDLEFTQPKNDNESELATLEEKSV
jgi:NADPH-dependent glutamate synthase beta subunit-like oxidoreductase